MANKKINHETDVITFSQVDIDTYAKVNEKIEYCQNTAEGLAQIIAGQLYIASQKQLYKLDDYNNVHEWAMDKHHIAKGTVSDSINTFERFGDGTTGELLPQYQEYTFSTLMRMKNLSDEQIELAQIKPTMSRAQVIDAIKALKVLEDKQKELPKYEAAFQKAHKAFVEAEPDIDTRLELIQSVAPQFIEKDHKITAQEYEDVTAAINDWLSYRNNLNEWDDMQFTMKDKVGVVATENFIRQYIPDFTNHADYIYEDGQLWTLLTQGKAFLKDLNGDESSTVEQEESQQDVEAPESFNEPETMPEVLININDYRGENGKLKKKELLEVIWKGIQEVEQHDIDLIISNIETE